MLEVVRWMGSYDASESPRPGTRRGVFDGMCPLAPVLRGEGRVRGDVGRDDAEQ